ncbi:MAG: hypothetical protein R6W90_08210 [Ignavibacteriaceae bacterium]
MNIIENKIDELISLYNLVLNELEELTEENFDNKLLNAKNMVVAANSMKKELISTGNKELIGKYERSLSDLTKQIQISYDNIVKEKHDQMAAVKLELTKLNNKKKIMAYER